MLLFSLVQIWMPKPHHTRETQSHVNMVPWLPFCLSVTCLEATILWRHNEHDGISNYQHLGCLLNRLFSADQWKQRSASLAFVRESTSDLHVDSPHKGPVTRKSFHLMTSSWADSKESDFSYAVQKRNNPCAYLLTQIAMFLRPTWGPTGSCRPQMGPTLAPMNLAIREVVECIRW